MTVNRRNLLIAGLCAPALHAGQALARPIAARQAAADDIQSFVRKAMRRLGTAPGLALAVVNEDGPALVSGHGVAEIRSGRRVDADTAFYIASATKSFTALGLAAMASRGEVDLDAPLAEWIGDTPLPADIAATVTLTDLLSHRSGVDNGPIAFRAAYSGDHTPAMMQALLARTTKRPDAPHGVFRYANAGYNLATTLLERRFGRDWRLMVRDEVLIPAGMMQTTAWVSDARRRGVTAVGHFADRAGDPVVSPLQKVDDTMQSAGGLMSTANDMARWLAMQIEAGPLVASTHRPQVAQETTFGPYRRDGYGLGWQTGWYGDDRLIHHFGNFAGSRAHVSFMPDRRIGVAVLINEDLFGGDMADLIANYAYDRLKARSDLETAYAAELDTLGARRDGRRQAVTRSRRERAARPWSLPQPPHAYAGTYENEALGTMRIGVDQNRLTAAIGVLSAVGDPLTDATGVRVELVPFQGQEILFPSPDTLVFNDETFRRQRA
ncbi:serine hydrolase [uncultured Brevundimonas sp.]|uniref:serine hydrolase n=1 Tax=uncultured Brevundimonas sp. TaxID=213418 RepID=UPI0025D4E13C|nr:serine hydrolase [uncultured Brevundimonas sp.]